ncbi:MAG: LCP family protein [Enterococcus sp.]
MATRGSKGKLTRQQRLILTIVSGVLVLILIVTGAVTKFYLDVSHSVHNTYEAVERQKTSQKNTIDFTEREPFSVLLLGVDTGELGRTEQGRSDAMMVATVNPAKGKTTFVSIARDTYVDIVGYGTTDKINHAYAFGGAGMAMDTVESYLGIPIDHYAVVNMKGIKELVDAVGGIEVLNEQQFENLGHTYDFGKISLTSDNVLGYTNMRYDDPNGDYGRQARQRQILKAIAQSLLTIDGVGKYQEILNAMEGNLKTDLSFAEMETIALEYRPAFQEIKQDQLQGTGFMQYGVSYQTISTEELTRVQDELKDQLN